MSLLESDSLKVYFSKDFPIPFIIRGLVKESASVFWLNGELSRENTVDQILNLDVHFTHFRE